MPEKQNASEVPRPHWISVCLVFFGIAVASCSHLLDGDESLVMGFRQAGQLSETGSYPEFVDDPSASGTVNIGGDDRESLTPPFPARIDFQVDVPAAAFLEFSPALVMVHDVRRARVEFRIRVTEEGESKDVYSEILRADAANQWHDRELDLSRWAGRNVLLTMETRSVPPRRSPLWAERVQTVWGRPVLGSRPAKVAVARAAAVTQESLDWLVGQLEISGVRPDRQAITLGFAVNLFLGGLLSLVVRGLYQHFARVSSGVDAFANTLPLFTLTTIIVIAVVQYSPALALGLVGALSVIRFRSAIARTEELAYLLLCVGLGVAVGANHVLLAATTVVVVAPFIALRGRFSESSVDDPLVLTLDADPTDFLGDDAGSLTDLVRRSTRAMVVERLDREPENVFVRARISVDSEEQLVELLTKLRTRVRSCQLSSLEPDPS